MTRLIVCSTGAAAASLEDVPAIAAPLQAATTEKWNQEGITKLMASASKLLQTNKDGNLVTPVVAQFAHQTIQEIEAVIATIEDEHKAAQTEIDTSFERFVQQTPMLKGMTDDVNMQSDVSTKSSSHKTCREAQVPLITAERECRAVEEDLKLAFEADEETLTNTYHSIKGRWCPEEYDEMDEAFFASNENDMTNYIEQKTKARESRKKYEEKKAECHAAQAAREAKQSECDEAQDQLEHKACEYGISVHGVNAHIHTVWHELTEDYNQAAENVIADAEDRQKEYSGVTIVKCLLQKIEANQLAEMPCNETHVEQVNSDITNCHNLNIDVAHLHITPKQVPDLPDLAHLPNTPCEGPFLAEHYAALSNEVLGAVQGRCNACALQHAFEG